MWRNRLGLLLSLVISVAALPSVTHSEEGSAQVTSTGDSGNHFSVTQMNFELGTLRHSTLVRIDQRTGEAWFLRERVTPQTTLVEWADVGEVGIKPKP